MSLLKLSGPCIPCLMIDVNNNLFIQVVLPSGIENLYERRVSELCDPAMVTQLYFCQIFTSEHHSSSTNASRQYQTTATDRLDYILNNGFTTQGYKFIFIICFYIICNSLCCWKCLCQWLSVLSLYRADMCFKLFTLTVYNRFNNGSWAGQNVNSVQS